MQMDVTVIHSPERFLPVSILNLGLTYMLQRYDCHQHDTKGPKNSYERSPKIPKASISIAIRAPAADG